MAKRILITSALPYANGSIHVGHLVEYIQTDIFVRFLKLIGKDVIYCCADDTHGAPIEINAKKLGLRPEQLIAKYFKEHTKDFKDFHIEFDSYYSTNSKENKKYSDLFFLTAKKKGFIYEKDIEHAYCENCKRFLPDRYIKGKCPKCGAEDQYGDICEKCNATHTTTELIDAYCTICKNKPVTKTSNHYFFKLSAFSGKLEKWLNGNKRLQPEVRNFVLNWIKDGLKDWDITRDSPYFGFNIPGEKDKYYYVWLDAPIGYISSTENYCKGKKIKTDDYWKKDAEIIHFIGKDIIYFHFLFWPALLMAAGFNLPNNLVVHGFLTLNREKMSKSRGTFLTAREYLDILDPEYLRFYYASNLSHKMSDLDLDWKDFKDKVNNELVANIGNFVYRVLSFTNKNFDSEISRISDKNFVKKFDFDRVKELYEKYEFREAVKHILQISSLGNKYFQDNEPWKLVKKDRKKAQEVITLSVNLVKNLAIVIKPILPEFSEKIEKQLNVKELSWKDTGFELKNHKIGKAEILIKKIEKDIVFENNGFSKLNIKVVKVLDIQDHPNADKLYIMKIDLGKEKRQLVAGLKDFYKKEEIKGKKIVVLTNLEHAKLRGVESEGMLLAGDSGDKCGLLYAEKSEPGDQVYIEGVKPDDKELSFKDFQEIEIFIKNNRAVYQDKILKTDKEEIKAEKCVDGMRVK